MEWWDMNRLIFHGKYEIIAQKGNIKLLSNLDCYDPTDYLDINFDLLKGIATNGRYEIFLKNLSGYFIFILGF
jgi:hypothetical protein